MKMTNENPGIEEYAALRLAAGARPISEEAIATGLEHSIYLLTVRDERAALIGMGRIIGDGGCYFQIVDLTVHPAYQGEEIGKAILSRLLEYIDANAPKEANVMVISDLAGIKLYQSCGFKLVYPDYYGMVRPVSE